MKIDFQEYDDNDLDATHYFYWSGAPGNTIAIFEEEIWPSIKKYFGDDKNILDVGCGNGRLSRYLSQYGKNVTAIDGFRKINPSLLTENMLFEERDFKDFNGSKFDVIFLFGVFYMLENWCIYKAFKKMLSLLNEDGVIIIIDDKSRDMSLPADSEERVRDSLSVEGSLQKSLELPFGYYNLNELSTLNASQIENSFIQKNNLHRITVIGMGNFKI